MPGKGRNGSAGSNSSHIISWVSGKRGVTPIQPIPGETTGIASDGKSCLSTGETVSSPGEMKDHETPVFLSIRSIMNVLLFGQLADAAGTRLMQVEAQADTDELIRYIQQVCPPLRGLPYNVAVNRDIIHANTVLAPDAEIALLPPYSGG